MTVVYEWDVEERAVADSENWAAEDIIDHRHQESFAQCVELASTEPPAGSRWQIVLVRDDDDGRSWDELDAGVLPEVFMDAYDNVTSKMPKRFHAEVAKVMPPIISS